MTISEIIRDRGISEVLHFTTLAGMLGILDSKAALSRELVSNEQRLEYILKLNSQFRRDEKWVNHVSLSITEINSSFFEISSKKWHPSIQWVIASFAPAVLEHEHVVFTTTNNAYHDVVKRGKGAQGLSAMFDERIRWGYYGAVHLRPPALPANLTTDVQAEVLYPRAVSTDFLTKIYAADPDTSDKVAAYMHLVGHAEVPIAVDESRFHLSTLRK